MIDFWLAAGLLLLIALSFLLIPVLRGRRAQREEDRTALNVALMRPVPISKDLVAAKFTV